MNGVGEIGHHLQVMLDPNHGHAERILDAQDESRQILAFVAVEPGRRLIQHQDRRRERERAGESDELLDAEREPCHARVAIALELDQFDDALDRLAVVHLLAPDRRKEQHLGHRIRADARVPPGQQIFEHRHLWKQLTMLEGACEA